MTVGRLSQFPLWDPPNHPCEDPPMADLLIRQPLGAQCSEPPRESRWPRDPAQVEPRWPVCPGGRDGIPLPTPHAAPRGARVNEVLTQDLFFRSSQPDDQERLESRI